MIMSIDLIREINKNNNKLFKYFRDHCSGTVSWTDICEEWNGEDGIEVSQYTIYDEDIDSNDELILLIAENDCVEASYAKLDNNGNVNYYSINLDHILHELQIYK